MCSDDNMENTNDKNKNEICETSSLTNNSNVENACLVTLMVKEKIRM